MLAKRTNAMLFYSSWGQESELHKLVEAILWNLWNKANHQRK